MAINPLATKVTIGVLSVGGLGFVAHQGYQMFNKKEEEKQPIIEKVLNRNKLAEEHYTPLSDTPESASHWTAILGSYKTAAQELRFKDFDGQGTENDALNTLKQKCKNALESDDSELLKKGKKWCVEPIKASDLLTRSKKRVLKTNDQQPEEEKTEWGKRLKAFKDAKQTQTSLTQLITIGDGENKDAENIVAMKKKCKEFGDTVSHAEKFEENLKNVEAWCIDKQQK